MTMAAEIKNRMATTPAAAAGAPRNITVSGGASVQKSGCC